MGNESNSLKLMGLVLTVIKPPPPPFLYEVSPREIRLSFALLQPAGKFNPAKLADEST